MAIETRPAVQARKTEPQSIQLIADRPLVLTAAMFAIAIAFAAWSPYIWAALVVALIAAIVVTVPRRHPASWLSIASMTIAIAGGNHYLRTLPIDENDVANYVGRGYVHLTGVVKSDVDVRGDFFVCNVAAQSLILPNGTAPRCSGTVRVRLKREQQQLGFGDTLDIRGALQVPVSTVNPGAFDYRGYLAHQSIFCTLTCPRPANWNHIDRPASAADVLPRLAESCKRSLKDNLIRVLSPIDSDLATGIILGGKGDLPGRVVDDFIAAGTVHILSASGMNVAMTAGLLWGIGRRLRLRRREATVLTLIGLSFYVLIAGSSPSVLRAFIMAVAFLFAPLFERDPDMPCAIAAASIIILIADPAALFDSGFQLSFAAVISIVACMPIGEAILERLPPLEQFDPWLNRFSNRLIRAVAIALMVSIAAQLGTMPLLARYYNQIALSSILANALIFWAVAPIMAAGFIAWPLALLLTPAAKLIALLVLGPLLAFMVGIAAVFGGKSYLTWSVPAPGALLIGIYYAVTAAAVWRLRLRIDRPATELAT